MTGKRKDITIGLRVKAESEVSKTREIGQKMGIELGSIKLKNKKKSTKNPIFY